MLYLACKWASAGGAPPCTLPTAPVDLGASAGNAQVTLTWPVGSGATGYNIKRALVPGGPYTVIGTSAASPYVDHAVVNGTAYYYVVSSTNACGESAGNSIESHATPVVPAFTYAPATAIITWTDINGAGQNGNLAFFNAHANIASVSNVNLNAQGLTSISGLSLLPLLANLNANSNTISTVDLSGCAALVNVDLGSDSMTTLNLSGCTSLVNLYMGVNLVTTLDISSCLALLGLYANNNLLTVLAVNTILSKFVTIGNTGGTSITNLQTPIAPPSVGPPNGIVAKVVLQAEVPPWNVTTD